MLLFSVSEVDTEVDVVCEFETFHGCYHRQNYSEYEQPTPSVKLITIQSITTHDYFEMTS